MSIVIHFDYDAFYCSCIEAENPQLRFLPLAVQQKQIVVTCNYEARRRGLHKLQLVKEARRLCPDVVIVLGEDLTRFRDYSKELYRFLRKFSWNGKVERLGFDEVWMDVTDLIDYNLNLLNSNDLSKSFFCLSRDDPTRGFAFDAAAFAGNTYPSVCPESPNTNDISLLRLRLLLGSHLARFIRNELEHHKRFTATVGVSTSKLLSKLVGNVKKPNNQTTLLPPYSESSDGQIKSNVIAFMDEHDVGKIPGIGFKLAQKLRDHVLRSDSGASLLQGGIKAVTVRDVRTHPEISPETLERILGGPGSPHGIGIKVWRLLHGVDDGEVGQAKDVPKQISIEDSYSRLDTYDEVVKELRMLTISLLKRMRLDLTEDDEDEETETGQYTATATNTKLRKKWLAHPRTLRLSTRPRLPAGPDGTRPCTSQRISRSTMLPKYVFSLTERVDALAERLVNELLLPLFRRLHTEKQGWNLSLINVAVTNMAEAAGDTKNSVGRDIAGMFKKQEKTLEIWRVDDRDIPPSPEKITEEAIDDGFSDDLSGPSDATAAGATDQCIPANFRIGSEDLLFPSQESRTTLDGTNLWDDGDDGDAYMDADGAAACAICGAAMPAFAMTAHLRFHELED